MRKLSLNITMTLDGFIAGPNNELDWMLQVSDPEMNADIVELFKGKYAGFLGYPTASGMIPYWSNVSNNPSASKGERAIAEAVQIHGIIVSNREVKLDWANTELLLAKEEDDLVAAVKGMKRQPGGDMLVSGGVRTVQTFARLGLLDEYIFLVHPVALGKGKSVFTRKVELELVSAKTYKSGVMRLCYRPRTPSS